jgi:hypothetical protein
MPDIVSENPQCGESEIRLISVPGSERISGSEAAPITLMVWCDFRFEVPKMVAAIEVMGTSNPPH